MVEYYYIGGICMNETENEVWKPIPGIPGVEINTHGDVYMLDYVVCDESREHYKRGSIRKQYLNCKGYPNVSVRIDGKWRMRKTHRLVALAFIPNPNNLPQVNHIDCDRTNCTVDNLEWCDNAYNCRYREKHGVSTAMTKGHSVVAINLATLETSYYRSLSEAGRALSVADTNIGLVVRDKRKTTKGYWFTRADNNAVSAARDKFGDFMADKVEDLMKDKKM